MNIPQTERNWSGLNQARRASRSMGWCVASVLVALLALATTRHAAAEAEEVASPPAALPAGAAYGRYAVGVASGFAVDALARFDPWNSVYGSADYRSLLRRIDSSGQRRTVVFQLWYPAAARAAEDGEERKGLRRPPAAASGRRANYYDFFRQDPHAVVRRGIAGLVDAGLVRLRDGGALAAMSDEQRAAALDAIGGRILELPQGAWQDATAAEGEFPLIVLAHGLGGNHVMWRTLGEFLASHGYVVAAPTFVSDGTLPLTFHDPASPFRNSREWPEVIAAYERMLGEGKVVPYFHRLLFGADRKIVPGGVERATTMMRNLFRQRVGDVALVLRTVRAMAMDEEDCRASLTSLGAVSAARPTSNAYLCGLLNGRLKAGNVGMAGHSLGAMTAQLAANHLPGVRAVFGLNNAPPLSWSPEEMVGGIAAAAPAGSRQPLLLMVGDEDAFVQSIFIGLFTTAVRAAGGDPTQAFPLAAERAVPDRASNPQPVALSGWQRALAERLFVIVRDAGHDTLVSEVGRLFPWPALERGEVPFAQSPGRTRKATGEAAFAAQPPAGESYDELGWVRFEDGTSAYMPHVIRDWYALSWFDWHLKGDAAAKGRVAGVDPFGARTHTYKDLR